MVWYLFDDMESDVYVCTMRLFLQYLHINRITNGREGKSKEWFDIYYLVMTWNHLNAVIGLVLMLALVKR